jgi:hypothetical protein
MTTNDPSDSQPVAVGEDVYAKYDRIRVWHALLDPVIYPE